ncbi:MAG: pantoate--beta-alanine ligase [Chthoniobacterales bacterium]
MQVIEKVALMQQACKCAARPVVFVPTMGALHEGHSSLIRHARTLAGKSGTVVVSIFLNPKQFNLAHDLELYPRPFAADQALCEKIGADLLFHPSVEEIYLPGASLTVHEDQLSRGLCGTSRPGHFEGVVTVLTKLFNIVAPNQVILGEKDWQQLSIVRRLVRDLNFPIEVISHPTMRETDGLAMSSRNARLSAQERAVAPQIYEALMQTRAHLLAGESDVATLLASTRRALEAIPNASIDYVELVEDNTLQPLEKVVTVTTPARLLVAVKIGETRLIDNVGLF